MKRCPNRVLSLEVQEALKAFARYRGNGTLPAAGGMLDQSMMFVEILDFLAPIWHRHDEIERERK